jgi:hypothetical protein
MKTTVTFFISVLLSALILNSCSSPEKRFQKAIKQELSLTLHDFKNYEPVKFDKIDIASSEYTDVLEVKEYLDESDKYLKLIDEYKNKEEIYDNEYSREKYLEYSKLHFEALGQTKRCLEKIDSIKLHFVPQVIGWKMIHTFRAKSLGGNLGLHHYLFYVDKEYRKVIKTVDLDNE